MLDVPPFLSLVIPAYCEAQRLPPTLERLATFAEGLGFGFEILIIVERGTDGTLEIAADFAARQAHFQAIDNGPQRGKGHAVRSGMLRARGDFLFYMDVDLSVPLREIPMFLDYFDKHPEVHVLAGNRQHPESRITRSQSWLRRTMGQTFNRVLQTVALAPLRDTQCGFKAFRRGAAQEVFSRQQLDGFAFDVEILLLAQKLGYRVEDLPVEWINSPESKVRLLQDSWRMLNDSLRVRRIVEDTLRKRPGRPVDLAVK